MSHKREINCTATGEMLLDLCQNWWLVIKFESERLKTNTEVSQQR